jgi:hypothetical protein
MVSFRTPGFIVRPVPARNGAGLVLWA